MPASAVALSDTGPLVALLDADDAQHDRRDFAAYRLHGRTALTVLP